MAKWWLLGWGWLWAQVPCAALYEVAGYAAWPGGVVELKPSDLREPIDSTGFFRFRAVCPGQYLLRVYAGEHTVAETLITVPVAGALFLGEAHRLHEVVIAEHLPRAEHVPSLAQLSVPEASLATWLSQVPGVTLSWAGPLLQKPVIEGLRGTRIAYWQAGQPLASQQWGEDHAPEIDPFSAEEIEVHVGPSPVRHGTEAIGGSVLLPFPSLCCLAPIEGRFLASGFWNGQGGLFSGRLQGTLRGWGYRFQGTLSRAGTWRTPSYFLTGTASRQLHGSFALMRLWPRWQLRTFYAQYNAHLGIFQGMHVGNLSDLERAVASPVPLVTSQFSYQIQPPFQQVVHELWTLSVGHVLPNEALLTLTYGRQYNRRQEKDAQGLYALSGLALDLQLTSHFVQLSYEKGPLLCGVFAQYQRNYRQYAYFIPGYVRWQGGAFLLYRHALWEGGLRIEPLLYDFYEGVILREGRSAGSRRHFFLPVAAELTRSFAVSHNYRLQLQGVFTSRAPNPAELYAYGYHQAQATLDIGANNLTLEPTFSLRGTLAGPSIALQGAVYYSPAWIWGQLGEPMLSLRGAALTLRYVQGAALWSSWSVRWERRLWGGFFGEVQGQVLWGEVRLPRGYPMPLLPGPNVTSALRWEKGPWLCKLSWSQVFRQVRYAQPAEYLPPPPGYGLLSAFLQYRHKEWTLTLSGDNLLNRRYRPYPNLMRFFADNPGRQIRVVMAYSFSAKKEE